MPGLSLKSELEIFKKRLEKIVSDLEWYYDYITFKQICYAAQTTTKAHIELIDDLIEEIQDNKLSKIQIIRAKVLLEPFSALNKIELLLKEAEKLAYSAEPEHNL